MSYPIINPYKKNIWILFVLLLLLAGCQRLANLFSSDNRNQVETEEIALPEPTEEILSDLERLQPATQTYFTPEFIQTLVELETESQVQLPDVDPFNLEGNIIIDGSFDLTLLTEKMYKRFVKEGYRGQISVSSISTDRGFQLFCEELVADIVQASRRVTMRELQTCAENGRLPIEFPIIIDAIAVTVHPENEFVDNLSVAELGQVFSVDRWSEINPEWPDESIIRFAPDAESGTFNIFAEQVLEGNGYALLNLPNTTVSDEISILHQGVSQNPYAISFFSYTHYQKHQDSLKLLSVEETIPSAASQESRMQRRYPLNETLFLYADMNNLHDKKHVTTFMTFFLSHIIEEGMPMGYFPVDVSVWDQSKAKFLQTINGEINIIGSSTVYPVVELGYEGFVQAGYKTSLALESGGSSAGIKGFCALDSGIDVGMASRRIRDEEIELCNENGKIPVGIRIGMDMLAVVVNAGNTFVQNASLEELALLFTAERWSDINPEWPEEPILRYTPSSARGEFGFFVERVFNDEADLLLNAPNTTLEDDMDVLMEQVVADVNTIGLVGYTHYVKRADELTPLSISEVPATLESAVSGVYPLTRPLMLYTDASTLQRKPQVANFVSYLLNDVEALLEQIGYVAVNERIKEEVWSTLLQAVQSDERFVPEIDGVQVRPDSATILAASQY